MNQIKQLKTMTIVFSCCSNSRLKMILWPLKSFMRAFLKFSPVMLPINLEQYVPAQLQEKYIILHRF